MNKTECNFITVANETNFNTLSKAQLKAIIEAAEALSTYETLADRKEELLAIAEKAKAI